MACTIRTLCAIIVLSLPIHSTGLRLTNSVGLRNTAHAAQRVSDVATAGPSNVDIADIHRYGFKGWDIVRYGQLGRENFRYGQLGLEYSEGKQMEYSEGKRMVREFGGEYVSAKPRNVIWDRIGGWNYTRSAHKTNPLIKVRLDGSAGALVKLDLALSFQYGGRVKGNWTAHPELKNKGRYLRDIRVIPSTFYVSQTARGGYTLGARARVEKVGRIGTRTDPVAETRLKITIEYGPKKLKGVSRTHWYTSEWEIVVQGTGHHSARKLSSTRPSTNFARELSKGDELEECCHLCDC